MTDFKVTSHEESEPEWGKTSLWRCDQQCESPAWQGRSSHPEVLRHRIVGEGAVKCFPRERAQGGNSETQKDQEGVSVGRKSDEKMTGIKMLMKFSIRESKLTKLLNLN